MVIILAILPATVFGDPFGIMLFLLLGVLLIWLVALGVNLLVRRPLVNGGLVSSVVLVAVFLSALLHHLIDPAPWSGEGLREGEPTSHFVARYLRALGVPLIFSFLSWHWFRKKVRDRSGQIL